MKFRMIPTNGVNLHVAEAGPDTGPLVVLLHGFPDFWYGWRHQIEALASAGYHVVAPDQRGCNLSDKPKGIKSYTLGELSLDVVGLIRELGYEKAHIAGHGFGGVVAWWIAIEHPKSIDRLAVLNASHPIVFKRHWKRYPMQILRNWFVFFFQLPWLPEVGMRMFDYWMMARTMRKTSRAGTFSADDIKRYREAWVQPSALTSRVHAYRALFHYDPPNPKSYRTTFPTLILWGINDSSLGRSMAQANADLCDHGRLVVREESSHWILHEEPELVTKMLTEFFSASEPGARSASA
jgi:pimeloyl-ACP methyl ester carboxylesterase